jgi:hypothetical protein
LKVSLYQSLQHHKGLAHHNYLSLKKTPLTTKPPIPSQVHGTLQDPSININLELHLPATDDAAIDDTLFEAMKQPLLS